VAVTGRSHSRDTLATLLWPEKDQQSARANLRRTLYDIGQLLGSHLLEVTAESVAISAQSSLWVDVEQFHSRLATALASDRAQQGLHATDLTRLVDATTLYTGDFMAGFNLPDSPDFDDWQFFQREELRSSFAKLLEELVLGYTAHEKWEEALSYTRRWLALDPLAEAVHRQLIRLYAQAGQFSAALRQYDECVRILAEELDALPEAETTALYEAIRSRRYPALSNATKRNGDKVIDTQVMATVEPTSSPPLQYLPLSPAQALPARTTAFVGRHQELAELLRRLRDPNCRLLTIVGPGGIGKTRIAIETAQAILESNQSADGEMTASENSTFKDGSFFVSLQAVNASSGVVSAIAGTLGLQFYSGTAPRQQLLDFLHEKRMLLVLDNFEHLLADAELVAEILAAAPGIKVLVTSREALKLHEEWFHPLAGMRLPPSKRLHSPPNSRSAQEIIAGSDAVQLFIQSAKRVQVTFEPETEVEEIVRICHLVDAMPLGIELAASWLKVLTCAQIAQEIERNIDILVAHHQNVPTRHRSMRVVLEHSWQLLDEEAQRALQRLSVFRGGFLQNAAATVAGADLLTLVDLVDKSWIYRTATGRYQMHELLRQYAADHMIGVAGEATGTQDRHAAFYLRQVAELESALMGPDQKSALNAIDAEIDNVQVAWGQAITGQSIHLIDLSNRALQPLNLFFKTRSRYVEAKEMFDVALHQLDPAKINRTIPEYTTQIAQLRLRLLARLGNFHLYQGDLALAKECFTTVLNDSQDPRELSIVYLGLGQIAKIHGDRAAAEAAIQQSLALARTGHDRDQMAEALMNLSDIASSWADFAEGKRLAQEALLLCHQLQHPNLTAKVIAGLAWATNCLGDYAESEKYYQDSLAISEAIGAPFDIAIATNFLGWVAFCIGGERLQEALRLHEQAMVTWRQIGHRTHQAMCLGDYALAACELGEYDRALRAAQEGLAITEELHHSDLTSYNSYCLAAAACGKHDFVTSQHYLLRSLKIASKSQISDNVCATLYFQALLFVEESKLPTLPPVERTEKQVQALELLALIIQHRATWQLFRDRALRLQTALADGLPAEVITAAIERGQSRTLAETVAEILSVEH
jgi:predicted ATPase/DNA-binding SARP family transcriptional activator